MRSRIEDLSGLRGGAVVVTAIEAMAGTRLPEEGITFNPSPHVDFQPLADPGLGSGKLILGVRRGRSLPVAAAVFTEQLRARLAG